MIPKIRKIPKIPWLPKMPEIQKIPRIPWRIDTPLKKPEEPYFTTTGPTKLSLHTAEDIGRHVPILISMLMLLAKGGKEDGVYPD